MSVMLLFSGDCFLFVRSAAEHDSFIVVDDVWMKILVLLPASSAIPVSFIML